MENNIPEQNNDAAEETFPAEESINPEETASSVENTEVRSEPEGSDAYEKPKSRKKPFNSYKRSAVKQFSSTLSLVILVPAAVLILIFVWCFPRSEKSEIENRNLEKFPTFTFDSYFSGEFTSGINKWFTDTTPFRDDLKNMGNAFRGTFGISTEETVNVIGDVKKVPSGPKKRNNNNKQTSTPEQSSESLNSEIQTSEQEQSSAQESSEEETSQKNYRELDAEYTVENGIIVVNQDGHYRAMEMFGGGGGDAYVDALNSLRSRLDDKIKIYSMIAPLASEFYTPANYSDLTANQKDYIDDVASRLDEGISYVDIDTALSKHVEESIYCRTDHHWMPLGAYYAAKEFAKSAGVEFKELSTYTPKTIEGFVGTMYAFTDGDINIKNDPEDFTYYIPDNYDSCEADFYDTWFNYEYTGSYFKEVGDPQSNAYLTFFGGDEQIVKIRTNVKNGRKLIEIKDSYGNAVPGYLMGSFEEIYIVDMRYFNLNLPEFIEQIGITDVLFTMVTYSAFGGNSYDMPKLLTQSSGITIIDEYKKEE